MTPCDDQRTELLAAIDGLYSTFASYRVTNLEGLGIYDFGPDEDELAAVRDFALSDIPKDALRTMEFYGEGWESWGSESEVKHFLPRLLQAISDDLEMLGGGPCSLFKFKLCGAIRSTRRAPRCGVRWPDDERHSLAVWANAAVAYHLHRSIGVLDLIEAVLEMGMRSDEITRTWSGVSRELRSVQVDAGWQPVYSDDEDVLAEAAKLAEWMGLQVQT